MPHIVFRVVVLVVTFPTAAIAAELHVDPVAGNDQSDGISFPVRSIAQAIRHAQPGDTIHLRPVVYRDWAAFFDKSGEPGKPITLDGHGATLDGCDRLNPDSWSEVEPGLFASHDLLPLTDAMIDRWFFVFNGRLNRMSRCSKGPSEPLKAPGDLLPFEWTFTKDNDRTTKARAGYINGSFWLKLPPNLPLSNANIDIPIRTAGVLIRGTSYHLVVRNLTATRPYNDGFNLSDSRNVLLQNIKAINCGDDGISAHGTCHYRVEEFTSTGNATGICDTGNSETHYGKVLIRDCIGFDLYFLDTGRYSVSDALIESSAVRALYLQGRNKPSTPCRLTLNNVLLRRKGSAGEIRINANCELTARNVTFMNLDLQATGGVVKFHRCYFGGTTAITPPRKPHMHLWKDSVWQGSGNWYDLNSARVAQSTFTASTFAEFQNAVRSDKDSRWQTASPADVNKAGIGSSLMPLPN